MSRRPSTLVAVAGLALVSPLAVFLPVPSGLAAAAAAGPVEEAREAARLIPFTARVEVRWVDAEGALHVAEIGMQAVGGTIRLRTPSVGAPGPVDEDDEDTIIRASAVEPGPDAGADQLLTPDVERKFQVEKGAGPQVAGRDTDEILLRSGGKLRERLAIDRETGLVLKREVLGPQGKAVRVVTVLQLDTAPVPAASGEGAGAAETPATVKVSKLPSAYRGPDALAGGYRRVGAYRHEDVVHLLYSDGLHGMSLFSQPGRLSGGALPPGGQAVRVGTSGGLHYTWPGGDVVTWQVGNVVHTLIGDGTSDDLLVAARSLPPPARPSLLERLRGTSRVVAELVSGGR